MPEFQYAGPGSSPGIDPAYLAQTCSPNPFHAMLYRVRSAIDAAPPGSRLSGLLWYQGENDAMVGIDIGPRLYGVLMNEQGGALWRC